MIPRSQNKAGCREHKARTAEFSSSVDRISGSMSRSQKCILVKQLISAVS
ncbi:uncharacterized protein PHALS_10341 [Plasmopara halstedii]|uniref:Uncharacterized protein n=1 Tax=Plasmopara halstedii TaxID=4781 RepID=A0A0P1AGR1_PLAHL|nr:uncharacterized protein PHALS_10341 [Plasmopara halstedii]CEG40124.1 hypothetical protein PHALS_10341 [Plasmopara halstedii]|eukprot:XP_024576493.1 hypothetical protein PHALS_10341 [Plasmopara halstedii]